MARMAPEPPPQVRDVAGDGVAVAGAPVGGPRGVRGDGSPRDRGRLGGSPPRLVELRMVAARSLRCCGERGLNDAGIRTLPSTSAGTGKSATASRLTCRPSVSTSGPGPANSVTAALLSARPPAARPWRGRPSPGRPWPARPADRPLLSPPPAPPGRALRAACRPGWRTTARPARRPPGTRMMSPGRSSERDLAASTRRELARARDRSPSRSDKDRLISAYSAKSPLSHVIAVASSSMAWRFLRTCRVRPTTPRSAWNCANDDSSRVDARARPAQPVRLTAML